MLEVAFKDTTKSECTQTRKDSDLFNVAQFKVKRKTSIKVVREMLFADIALAAHSAEEMQSLTEEICKSS